MGVLVAVAAGSTLWPEPVLASESRAPYRDLAKIQAPRDGSFVRGSKVRVVVRAKRRSDRTRIYLGGRQITKRFHRERGGRLVARLKLNRGRHSLYLRTSRSGVARDFDHSSFVVARIHEKLIRATVARRSHGVPLMVRARLRGKVSGFRLVVNGHRVPASEVETRAFGVKVAKLGANDGVRFGKNRVAIRAFDETGRFDVDRFKRRIGSNRPLPGAGRTRAVTVKHRLRLNGRSSRTRSRRLHHRWRVIEAPPGSGATIVRPHVPRPRFKPDVNGTYRLRLTATDSKGRKASDEVRIDAAPRTPPIGLPVNTIPGDGKGVTIDGVEQKVTGNWVQVVVYDRQTMAIDTALSTTLSTGDDPGKLTTILGKAGGRQSIILTGGDRPATLDKEQVKDLRAAIKKIGGTERTFEGKEPDLGLGTGSWSVLGAPGLSAGSAIQSFGPVVEAGVAHGGSLDGLLQLDSRQQHAFVWPDYIPFTVSGKAVTIGEETYTSDGSLGQVIPGFHLVVLDQNTLEPFFNLTYSVAQIGEMGDELASIVKSDLPLMVVVHSINQPAQGEDTWSKELTPWIGNNGSDDNSASLGGTAQVFNLLDGQGDYALVGGTNLPDYAGTETLSTLTGSSSFEGVLSRNRQGQFVGDNWSPAHLDPTLFELAYQPDIPWPASNTPGLRAATAYFAEQLGLEHTADIRQNYIDDPGGANWNTLAERLNNPAQENYVPCPNSPDGFTEADCTAVRAQLLKEFPDVASVVKMISDLQNTFGSGTGNLVNVADIAQHVENLVQPPANAPDASIDPFGIAEGVFEVAEVVPGVSQIADLAVAGFTIAGAVESAKGGPDAGEPITNMIQTRADDLAAQLAAVYLQTQGNLDHMRDILLSDWGKLQVAAEKHADGEWDPTSTVNQDALTQALELATERQAYGSILPLAYSVYGLENQGNPVGNAGNLTANQFKGGCSDLPEFGLTPFLHASPHGQYRALPRVARLDPPTAPYGQFEPVYQPYVLGVTGKYRIGELSEITPKASLVDPLFRNPADSPAGGLGLDQPTFFGQNFGFTQAHCRTADS